MNLRVSVESVDNLVYLVSLVHSSCRSSTDIHRGIGIAWQIFNEHQKENVVLAAASCYTTAHLKCFGSCGTVVCGGDQFASNGSQNGPWCPWLAVPSQDFQFFFGFRWYTFATNAEIRGRTHQSLASVTLKPTVGICSRRRVRTQRATPKWHLLGLCFQGDWRRPHATATWLSIMKNAHCAG